jgi:hypothetical protein
MITIAEVIEQCALEVEPSEDHQNNPKYYIGGEETMELLAALAADIRALAAQYEGCIVADGEVRMTVPTMTGYKNLYRAKEPTK